LKVPLPLIALDPDVQECGQLATPPGNGIPLVVAAGGGAVAEFSLGSLRPTVRLGSDHASHVEAVGLGRRRLALALRGRAGRFSDGPPAGVELLDIEARTRETIDRAAGEVRVSGQTLLTFEGKPFARGQGIGIRGYGLDGDRRFRLLTGEHVAGVEIAGRFAYALGPGGVAIVDPRAGRVVHRSTSRFNGELLAAPPRSTTSRAAPPRSQSSQR
jgi:hypothetical protein